MSWAAVSEAGPAISGRAETDHVPKEESSMLFLAQPPIVFAAIGYSILYLLCGGGLMGAIVIFIVAKALNK